MSSTLTKAFLKACEEENLDQVKECIEKGVDVNATDESGTNFALYEAALQGHEDLCDLLLTYPEVDVNKKNSNNFTALMESCVMGNSRITKKILAAPGMFFQSRKRL